MPWASNKELPEAVRGHLPEAAQSIFRNAFNSAHGAGDAEEVAMRKAWAAVKNAGYAKGMDGMWHKESHRVALTGLPLVESYDAATGRIVLNLISPGFNTSKSRFYPAEVLRRDHGVFDGVKMFMDHPTPAEEKARPERSVRDWVGLVERTFTVQDGSVKGEGLVIDPALREKLTILREHGKLSEAHTSIRGVGEGREDVVEGHATVYVESLLHGRSVDFVTQAGAGGRIEAFEAAPPDLNLELIGLEELQDRRPDLIELVEAEARKPKEGTMTEEQLKQQLAERDKALAEKDKALTESQASLTTATKERDEARTKLAEAERKEKQATVQVKVKEALAKTKLPEETRVRIAKRFETAESVEGLEAAITEETNYLAKVAPSRVKNLGESDKGGEHKVDLTKSFQELGLSEAAAKIAARGY